MLGGELGLTSQSSLRIHNDTGLGEALPSKGGLMRLESVGAWIQAQETNFVHILAEEGFEQASLEVQGRIVDDLVEEIGRKFAGLEPADWQRYASAATAALNGVLGTHFDSPIRVMQVRVVEAIERASGGGTNGH